MEKAKRVCENAIFRKIINLVPAIIAAFGFGMMIRHFASVSAGYDPGILYRSEDKFLAAMLAMSVIGAILGTKLNRPWERGGNLALMAFFIFMIIGKSLLPWGEWMGVAVFLVAILISIPLLFIVVGTSFKITKESSDLSSPPIIHPSEPNEELWIINEQNTPELQQPPARAQIKPEPSQGLAKTERKASLSWLSTVVKTVTIIVILIPGLYFIYILGIMG
jgi:hypothetical protein